MINDKQQGNSRATHCHLGTFLFTFLSLILIIWALDGFTVTNMTRYVSLRDEKKKLETWQQIPCFMTNSAG